MYNRNQNIISHILQTPVEPKSRNVLWDNGTLIKIWRKEGWVPLLGSNGEDLDLSKYLETTVAKTMFAPISIMDWYNNINEYLEYDATSSAIICKTNLIVQGDTSSEGSGSDNPGGGLTFSGILYKDKHYSDFTADNYLNINSLVEDLDLSQYVKSDDIKGLKNWYSNTGVNIVKDGWLTVSTSGKGLQNTDISSGGVAKFYFNKSDNRWHSNKSISADADLFIGSTLYANSLENYGIGLSGSDVGGIITIHEKGTWKATAIRINTDGSTKVFKNLQAVEGINVTKTENASNEGTSGVAGVFIRSEGGIELSHSSTPYIDFHANKGTEDFTIRIAAAVYSNGAKQFNLHGATALMTQSDANIGSSGTRWNELYCKKGDFNDSLNVLKNVTVGGNLVVAGDVSSGGNGQDVPTGIDESKLEEYLTENGYATQSWVIGSGYITSSALDPYQKADTAITTSNIGNQAVKYASILGSASDGYTKSQIESALNSKQTTIDDLSTIRSNATNGNIAYSWGNHANVGYASKTDLNGYLPIVGGRLTGALEITSGTNSRRGVLKADISYTNNIGCLQIGVNVGDEIPIGISLAGIEPYLIANDKNSKIQGTVVGIGRAYTVDELKALCRPDSAGKMQIYGAVIDKGLLVQNGDVKIEKNLIVEGDVSSGGSGQNIPSGGVTEEDVEQYLTNYVNDIITTGSGNVISSVNKSGNIITFTKDVTALTSQGGTITGELKVNSTTTVNSLKVWDGGSNVATLLMDRSSLSIDRELKLSNGGFDDISESVKTAFKTDRAQIKTLIGRDVYIGADSGTSSNGYFNIKTYNGVSSNIPVLNKTVFTVDTSGNITNSTWHGTTIGVAYGGTGRETLTSGYALIGNGNNAVSLRGITNNTSATAVTAGTNLITANTLYYHTGNSNISTVGTITSGTWQGTKIANAYLANSAITIAGSSVSLGGNIEASTITSAQIGSGNSFYHSGNANLTSVAWKCSSLTMGGALSGATTGSFSSTLTAKKIIISSTSSEEQLKFSRGGANSIAAVANGYFRFLSNGKSISGGDANADLIIKDSLVRVNGNFEIRNGISVFSGTNGDYSEGLRLHAATDGWNALMFCGSDNTGGTGTSEKSWGIFTDPSSNFIINKNASNNAATYAFCNVGGNWGIGTLAPAYKLHVDGETSSNIYYGGAQTAYSKNTSGMFRWGTFDDPGGLKLQFGAVSNSKFEIVNYAWGKALFSVTTEGLCTVGGDLIVTGDTSSGSDIRYKNIIEPVNLDLDVIASAPLFTFKWNNKDDNFIHLGTSAQYWENTCEGLVNGEEFKTLNYASLGVAMGISLAKRMLILEKENNYLKEELRRIKHGC